MKAALLVIDLQKDFFRSGRLKEIEGALVPKVNELTDVARRHSVPVIWVRQEMKPDGSDAPLGDRKEGRRFVVHGTEGATLLDGLERKPEDLEVVKTRYSAFYKTELEALLAKLGVDTLIVSGINTHACVRMAAIDAYERDFEVILALDGIDSWDEEHHRVTVKYLSGKITTAMTNREVDAYLATIIP